LTPSDVHLECVVAGCASECCGKWLWGWGCAARSAARLKLRRTAALVLSLLAVGCGPLLSFDKKEAPADCPRLDSQLLQLANASDPRAYATERRFDYRDGMVRVIVELRNGAELPTGHGLAVEARNANLVQGRAPVDRLCALAADSSVASVRPPAAMIPEAP